MKKNILFIICICLNALIAQAQEMPQAISYQAIARDAAGKIVSNKAIGVKVELVRNNVSGNVVFSETHTTSTNATGTITLLIGKGNSNSGNFADIDWGADTYFLKLSMDIEGGNNYKEVSTTQILPVPFALYAAKAGSVENGGSGEGNNTAKYVLAATHDDDIYIVADGGEIASYDDFYLKFGIIYLDGNNQNINAEIEGLPEGVSIYDNGENGTSPSTAFGRSFILDYRDFSPGTYKLKLVLKDGTGNKIKEYPFTYIKKQS